MSILIFALIVLIVAGLIAWAVQMLPLPAPFGMIVQALILIVAAIVIAQRAGLTRDRAQRAMTHEHPGDPASFTRVLADLQRIHLSLS